MNAKRDHELTPKGAEQLFHLGERILRDGPALVQVALAYTSRRNEEAAEITYSEGREYAQSMTDIMRLAANHMARMPRELRHLYGVSEETGEVLAHEFLGLYECSKAAERRLEELAPSYAAGGRGQRLIPGAKPRRLLVVELVRLMEDAGLEPTTTRHGTLHQLTSAVLEACGGDPDRGTYDVVRTVGTLLRKRREVATTLFSLPIDHPQAQELQARVDTLSAGLEG